MTLPVSKETGCETYLKSENYVIPEHRVILHTIKLKSFMGYRDSVSRFLSWGLISTEILSETKSGKDKYRMLIWFTKDKWRALFLVNMWQTKWWTYCACCSGIVWNIPIAYRLGRLGIYIKRPPSRIYTKFVVWVVLHTGIFQICKHKNNNSALDTGKDY